VQAITPLRDLTLNGIVTTKDDLSKQAMDYMSKNPEVKIEASGFSGVGVVRGGSWIGGMLSKIVPMKSRAWGGGGT
jgi:hypothetical protein